MTGDISFWLDKNADFTPNKIAIRFEGAEITYQDFAKKVHSHSRALKHAYGIGRGDRVAPFLSGQAATLAG